MSDRGLANPQRSAGRTGPRRRVFLFLQGPISPFFARLAAALEARGHRALRVNLCFGDWLFWRRPEARSFRGRVETWPAWIANLCDVERVTDLILLGEQRPYHKEAISAAKARGIRVVVTDFGYLRPGWLTFELDGMSGASRFPRDPAAIRRLARQAAEPVFGDHGGSSFAVMATWDVIYNVLTSVLRPLYPHYRSHHIQHPVLTDTGIGVQIWLRRLWRNRRSDRALAAAIAAGQRYYLLPLQIEKDYQIRAYSDYDGLATPIREVIGSFARSAPAETLLFVKLHPFDPGLQDWRRVVRIAAEQAGVGARIRYVHGGSIEAMIAGADGIVTVNSSAGLQALRAGRPVKVLGQAIYDVPGLTFQGPLDRFWTDASAPDPAFLDDFVRALAATVQIRGDFYARPGLDVAVAEAVERLDRDLVNVPWPRADIPALPETVPLRAQAG